MTRVCSPPRSSRARPRPGAASSPDSGTHVDGGLRARRPDELNVANTSMLDHHGELLALWEGGSASVIDRDTLAWQGFKVWGDSLEVLPFTAHPKVEPDGTVWAFGTAFVPAPALVLYHIGAAGAVVKVAVVDPGTLGMVHDFVVTARHLVIVLPPPGVRAVASRGDAARRLRLAARPGLSRAGGRQGRFRHAALVPAPGRVRLSSRQRVGGRGRRHSLRPLCRLRPGNDDRDDACRHARRDQASPRRSSTPGSRSTPTDARRSSTPARSRSSPASRPR